MEYTFEQLPQAVGQLFAKLDGIEKLLLKQNPGTTHESEELLTIDEASAIINLTKPTIYGLVSKALIPFCKKGKRLYFLKSELLAWVKSGRKKTNQEIAAEAENLLSKSKRR